MGLDVSAFSSSRVAVECVRAGSYSGYNEWRTCLSRLGMGVEAGSVWEEPEKYAGKPFYEIVNFSDCEGTIDHATCVKLAEDFRSHMDRAEHFDSAYFFATYKRLAWVFEAAAKIGGYVEFH